MTYLLDSNVVSDLYNLSSLQHDAVYKRFSTLTNADNVYVYGFNFV